MNASYLDAMRRATQAVRDGKPLNATRMIQDALTGNNTDTDIPHAPADDDFDGVTIEGVAGSAHQTASSSPIPPATMPMLSQSYRGPHGGRDYRLFLPPQAPSGIRGLVVMLHGCGQNPDDFARGTALNALAAREALIVAYPGQGSADNPNGCWNWFDPSNQRRGAGEAAILAGLAQEIAATHAVPPGAVFAAGLSAGGAMAAILGLAYSDVFSAIGVHSGLAAGSAQDVSSAFAAMNGSGSGQGFPIAKGAPHARAMIVHGRKDRTVVPSNGAYIFDAMKSAFPDAALHSDASSGEGVARHRLILPDGTVVAEYWDVETLGHAWSGGDKAGSYTAPNTPDASEGLIRFFLDSKGR